jgi:hypothetical protein
MVMTELAYRELTRRRCMMLKAPAPDGYPPEPGRYLRGNDLSPVAVAVILL